ncbi:protein translocase subunit SecF [Rhodospirillaceae bacterium SYSU D60014]|uniref:protein translocase subunit SecF n=1 Tax=Virgifigura deserti TaxID=2268457 RepID=UPI000E668034
MFRGIQFIRPDTRINFMRPRRTFILLSLIMMLGSIGLVAFKGLNFGIDFEGGILMEVRTPGTADLTEMRDALADLGLGEVALQEFGSPDDVLIRIQRQEGDEAAQVRAIAQVKEALGEGYEYRRTEFVGPTVGAELVRDAITAIVLAIIGIMIYIWFRFEWQFAVNAIIALFHDVITTVGLFALLGLEFNLTSVAAVLTVAGYSINDTVVVYDRVREELRRYKTMPLPDLINLAINKTLSRTIMTGGSVLLVLIVLYVFGGDVLGGFSLALIWGVLIGTYSTVFVAAPMLIYFNLRPSRSAKESTARPAADPAGSGD